MKDVKKPRTRLDNALSGKQSQGRTQYVRYLRGERLTQRQAILAKCFECGGYYADGRKDCEMPDCALYPYMPYKGKDELTLPTPKGGGF